MVRPSRLSRDGDAAKSNAYIGQLGKGQVNHVVELGAPYCVFVSTLEPSRTQLKSYKKHFRLTSSSLHLTSNYGKKFKLRFANAVT